MNNSKGDCPMTEMIPVASSTIRSIGYDEETEHVKSRLTVVFNSGAKYVYEGVPRELWERFKETESVGRFFVQEIKNSFRGVKQ
ncbi:MAG: KTSC domain-containing protein [Thermodesulfobacteriota bacterium]|nr:KTSC domain-containing protein [Thermodesulfobacteriota bacterium]